MKNDLIEYYKERAKEYESIYLKPERQNDLKTVTKLLQNIFANKTLIEIACGTGYWTESIAKTAKAMIAIDINKAVLEIAEQKHYPYNNVSFKIENLYNITNSQRYDNLFGGFIWSHIKLEELDVFLKTVNSSVVPGATVVFMDNNFVEGSSTPIKNTDEFGNTFQTRKLKDESTHVVLKNFPTENFLETKLKNIVASYEFINLTYFWLVIYKTKGN
ncbi:class I SAM-dependent methyltransferase [Aurantibacillus circumpalustris]|uniref:class I SAM-dependent methyltransferase n=1 Tax=Aurantibacillus circumpalustris TaxID=3036359 RepID=UPI00295A7EBE|nr:class I SAM-dependent methyltransferase [Aurantibacillus circumpalustris]